MFSSYNKVSIKYYLSAALKDINSHGYRQVFVHSAKMKGEKVYKKREEHPFTGVMIGDYHKYKKTKIREYSPLNPYGDLCIPSHEFLLNGHRLGKSVIDGKWFSTFGDPSHHHGLMREVNKRYRKKPFTTEGYGIGEKAVKPECMVLSYFNFVIDDWENDPSISEQYGYLPKNFFDKYLSQKITQANIIKAFESVDETPTFSYDFSRNCIDVVTSINNFDRFMNDEMNNVKEEFKYYKQINSISDCANLLFIFNPKFRDIYEESFARQYRMDYVPIEREKLIEAKEHKQQQQEVTEQFHAKITQTKINFELEK